MSYVLLSVVLFLWIYDRNLLVRLQKRFWKQLIALGWILAKIYADSRKKNDMLKDGYHVDSVYLHEYQSASYVRKLDVLRSFRDEIREETFTQAKSVNIWEFIEMCTEEGSNFGTVNRNLYHELEVNYTMDMKQYKIIYTTQDNHDIRFPIYTEDEVRQNKESQGIISALVVQNLEDEEGIDVTDDIIKFAGPLENFYDDSEFIVRREWLSKVNIKPNAILKIMDLDGEEHIFNQQTQVLTLKNNHNSINTIQ